MALIEKEKKKEKVKMINETVTERKVSIPLAFGILFMPYIFSWFTLRKGYHPMARLFSFAWVVMVIIMVRTPDKSGNDNSNVVSAQTNTEIVESQNNCEILQKKLCQDVPEACKMTARPAEDENKCRFILEKEYVDLKNTIRDKIEQVKLADNLNKWFTIGCDESNAACNSERLAYIERNDSDATIHCQNMVESSAKWQMEWTDGFLERKFNVRFMELRRTQEQVNSELEALEKKKKRNLTMREVGSVKPAHGALINLYGSKAKFQNGFGAWQKVMYGCVWDLEKNELVSFTIL